MTEKDFNITVPSFPDRRADIAEYGAVRDVFEIADSQKNAAAINAAIADLSKQGGGTVIIPAGLWVSGPIRLESNICLFLEKQAVLKFSKNREEYPLIITNYEGQECIRTVSPLTAENAENIAVSGGGIIDGSGDLWRPVKKFKLTERQWLALLKKSPYVIGTKEGGIWLPTESAYLGNEKNIQKSDEEALAQAEAYYDFYRPVMVSLKHCKNVLLEGVTFMNSPAWNIHPFFCENLTVRNVNIRNPYYAQNGDGIDIESCKNVHLHDSIFETGDDAICLKAGKNAQARSFYGPCENVYIHDCLVNEGHGGFTIGSEMSRSVRNVLVERCTFIGTDVGIRFKSAIGRGGTVENIEINNVHMLRIKEEAVIMTMAYVLNLLNRNEKNAQTDESDVPYFKNIRLNRLHCMGAKRAVKIEPIEGRPETISDVVIMDSWFVSEEENICEGKEIRIEQTKFQIEK